MESTGQHQHQQQQLVLSAEDAAHLLAQAGIQLGDNEQVIIGDIAAAAAAAAAAEEDDDEQHDDIAATADDLQQQTIEQHNEQMLSGGGGLDDGAVLYIDPNDPQAAEILQQAGLRLTHDGTVTSLASVIDVKEAIVSTSAQQQIMQSQTLDMPSIDAPISSANTEFVSSDMNTPLVSSEEKESPAPHPRIPSIPRLPPTRAPPIPANLAQTSPTPKGRGTKNKTPSPTKQQMVQMTPDQQQVLYSVTGEDGKTQQYMMLCPKDMDQNLLIQTLVKQVSSDPALKGGKKTIKITQQKGAVQKITGLPPGSRVVSQTTTPSSAGATPTSQPTPQQTTPTKKGSQKSTPKRQQPAVPRNIQQQQTPQSAGAKTPGQQINNDLFNSAKPMPPSSVKNVVDATECFESVMPELAMDAPIIGGETPTRVYVRCNYCPSFRSTLNGDTWEAILNHILPVAKEEIQTSFYGDLGKHFVRSLRLQVNGRQLVRKAPGLEVPQCEVILTHSLICRKTKREFIVSNPDANFVASLAKHIRTNQPGNSGRGNSLLCIFCNSPFTHEDYLRHIQPHLDAILATLNCYAGAYCSTLYESTIRAARNCNICQEPESADLRFLPCTKFSADYNCTKKLQFAVDCFREHYGDSGFLRLNTSTVARCSVCKNTQQVYCAVFHISTRMLATSEDEQDQEVNTQLAVCINCQKQFINIVMKEQGFDERLKLFQLKNMEQLCSVLRVILNQAVALCEQKKTVIYTVHENSSNPNSAVHLVRSAEVTQFHPVTRLLFLAESEVTASATKAFFVCDLCLFSVDLTSLVATDKEKQKNDMLLAIVLEHLVPHTESLMNVIASNASNRTFSLKYEILCRVQDNKDNKSKKLVLSLQKKFKSQHSHLEIPIDKDEEKTMSQLRAAVKADRKNYIALKNAKGQTIGDTSAAGQLIEVNKYIEKQKGKLGILAQTGCNTTLLNFYTECRLCSKFSFPDFRLCAGAHAAAAGTSSNPKIIDLCENCVETVLTLCLPTEPETLQDPEECLALEEPRAVGHRLVLSNNLKKWLSLDGVKLIKKTVDEFEEAKQYPNDCSTVFQEALKRHCIAVIKTCLRDEDITGCAAGFCITEPFLGGNREDDETAAALASLEQQIGMPIREKPKTPILKPNEVQVTILSRRKGRRISNAPFGQGMQKSLPVTPATITPIRKNGATPISTMPLTPVSGGVIKTNVSTPLIRAPPKIKDQEEGQEESVSAIQSFLDATAGDNDKSTEKDDKMKVPAGVKITPAGKGTVNIKAVNEGSGSKSSERSRRSSGRVGASSSAVRDLSMVTLTPNGVVKKVVQRRRSNRNKDEEEEELEEELDSEEIGEELEENLSSPKKEDGNYEPPSKRAHDESPSPEKGTGGEDETPGSRSKRTRREKKIFDL